MPKLKERFITNEKGQKEAVVLDVKTYEELIEDLEDLYLIAERKKEPSLSLETVKRSLKRSGIL
ncbi:MAG: hypothetical protein ABIJ26_01810 [Candidatus Margulisiibacteriota bacterium]